MASTFRPSGEFMGAVNVLVDIDNRKRAEEYAQRLAAIVECSDDAIISNGLDGMITSWNRGAERLFGYTAAEAIGKPVSILIPPDRENEEPEILERIRGGQQVDHYETVHRRKDGSRIDISLTVSPIRNAEDRIIGFSRIARDVTDRRQADQTAQRLAAIVEFSDDAILTKNLDGIITSWNQGAKRLFGYAADEAIGQPVTMLIPAEHLDEEPMILGRIRSGDRIDHYETVRQRKDGSLVDISLTVSPIRNAAGAVVGASKVARDITERRRAREQQSLLLREMDHRIRNLFSLASSVVTLSARSARTPKELATDVESRMTALARAHSLTLTKSSDGTAATERAVKLHELIKTLTLPYEHRTTDHKARVAVSGSDIQVSAQSVISLALLLHEFTTNAAKYGALSTPDGHIEVDCRDLGSEFVVTWQERGGPRVDHQTDGEGFGSVLTRTAVRAQLGGTITRDWAPEGLTIRLSVARDRLAG